MPPKTFRTRPIAAFVHEKEPDQQVSTDVSSNIIPGRLDSSPAILREPYTSGRVVFSEDILCIEGLHQPQHSTQREALPKSFISVKLASDSDHARSSTPLT
jgi:hypothetical protein